VNFFLYKALAGKVKEKIIRRIRFDYHRAQADALRAGLGLIQHGAHGKIGLLSRLIFQGLLLNMMPGELMRLPGKGREAA